MLRQRLRCAEIDSQTTAPAAIHDAELGLLLPYVVNELTAAAAVDISSDPFGELRNIKGGVRLYSDWRLGLGVLASMGI